MQSFTVELTLGINAMTEESAENKLDTFLSALDLKKNDKMELVELGELVNADGEPIEADESSDDDWDDEWANEDWDTIDEDDAPASAEAPEEDDDSGGEPEPEEADELSKLLSEINAAKGEDEEDEETPTDDDPVEEVVEEDDDEDWGDWDDDWE